MLTSLQTAGHDVTTHEWGDDFPSVIEQDWVVHIGAISSTTERNVEKVLTQNYDFSCQLFDQCKTFGVNMQYASSASVYGLISTFREDALVDPRTPYAWSKYLFERYHAKHQGGNIVQGFRYFNVCGPEGEEHKGNQASPFFQFKKQAEETGKIKVFENSEQYCRDFVHVSEVVETHNKFFNIKESGVWNIGTGKTMSFLDVAKTFNVPIETIPMPEILKNNYQAYTCADTTKLRKTLND
jgi:ADP-L-glycero-D-manno-heptose 6-epimerase